MKKNANNVLIIILIINLIFIISIMFFGTKLLNFHESTMSSISNSINEMRNQTDEIDDVTGYGILLNSIGLILFGGASVLVGIVLFFMIAMFILDTLWCIVGRLFLIGQEKNWKLNIYRAFIIVHEIFMTIFVIICVQNTKNIYLILITSLLILQGIYNIYLLCFKTKIEELEEVKTLENQIMDK